MNKLRGMTELRDYYLLLSTGLLGWTSSIEWVHSIAPFSVLVVMHAKEPPDF
jgi:hypothetical protein